MILAKAVGLEGGGKLSAGLIVSRDCCFCHCLPLLLPGQSRAVWSPGGQAQGTNPALAGAVGAVLRAAQSVQGLPPVRENRPSFGVCLVAVKECPLEGRNLGKGVGAVALPECALAAVTGRGGQSCSC